MHAFTRQLDAVVEGGDHQQRQERRGDHATDDGNGHGAVELRSRAHAHGHGHHAGHQRERGHQDGAQAFAARVHQRLFAINSALLFLARGVQQQDGILCHQPHQHDHADQAHQV